MIERSKALVEGTSLFGGLDSNPTAAIISLQGICVTHTRFQTLSLRTEHAVSRYINSLDKVLNIVSLLAGYSN